MALNNLGLGFTISAKDAASGVFGQVDKAVGNVQKTAEKTGSSLDDVGEKLQKVGAVLMAAGAAGFAGLGMAVGAANEFGSSVAKVQTIADAAQFPIETIRNLGFEMADAYGGKLETQLTALYSAIGSGASTAADASAVMASANKLAVGGLTSVDKSMTLLMGTMNAYGLSLQEAGRVSDAFFMAVKLGGSDMSVDSMVSTLSGVTPIAAAAGMTIDELLGSIARLTAVGVPTAQAVTGMKAAIEGMIKPTKDAQDEAKRLGIEFSQAALKSKGIAGVIKDITSSAKFNDLSFSKLFTSTEALGAMLALGANQGDDFVKFMDQMGTAAGSTDFAFKTMADTAVFLESVLKAKLQTAMVKIGEIVAPILGKVMTGVSDLVGAFNNLPEAMQRIIVLSVAFGSAFLVLAGGALIVAGTLMGLVAMGEAAGVALLATIGVVEYLTGALVVGAGIVYGFRKAFETSFGGLDRLFDRVKLAFTALSQIISEGGVSDAVMKALQVDKPILDFVTQVGMWVARIGNFFSGIKSGFDSGMSTMGPTLAILRQSIEEVGQALGLIPDGLNDAKASFASFGGAGKSVGSVLAGVFDMIVSGISVAVRFIGGFASGFRGTFTTMLPILLTVGEAFSSLFGVISAAFFGISASTSGTGAGIRGFGQLVGSVAGMVVTSVSLIAGVFAALAAPVIGTISAIITVLSGLADIVMGTVGIITGILTGDWDKAWTGMKMVALGVAKVIIGAVSAIVSVIAALIDNLGRLFGMDIGAQKGWEAAKASAVGRLTAGAGLTNPTIRTGESQPGIAPGGPVVPAAPVASSDWGAVSIPAPGEPPPATMPATAQAQASGARDAAMADLAAKVGTPPPVNTTITNNIHLDSEVIATHMDRHSSSNNARSYGPSTTST